MTVAELIKRLSTLPPEEEVGVFCDGGMFRILHVWVAAEDPGCSLEPTDFRIMISADD